MGPKMMRCFFLLSIRNCQVLYPSLPGYWNAVTSARNLARTAPVVPQLTIDSAQEGHGSTR